MPRRNSAPHKLLTRFVIFLALVIISVWIIAFCSGRITVFFLNKFTDYHARYDGWSGHLLSENHIGELRIENGKYGFRFTAKNVFLAVRPSESIRERKLIVDCLLEDVRFGGEDAAAPRTFMTIPFLSSWRYKTVVFKAACGTTGVEISGIEALADNISITGNLSLSLKTGDIRAAAHMSVAPDVLATSLGDFREMFFTPEDNGWYGSNLSLEGSIHDQAFRLNSDRIEINIRGT